MMGAPVPLPNLLKNYFLYIPIFINEWIAFFSGLGLEGQYFQHEC